MDDILRAAFADIDDGAYLDVPFVPTDEQVVEAMLDLADVGPDDVLYDLGSGDGRILVSAAIDRNTRGVGIDIDPLRIAEAMEYAGRSHVEYLVDFIEDNIFTADISEATVVTLYLLRAINLKLRPRLLKQLRPGTRIVSHAFDMGDWKPDEWLKLSGVSIMKWIVPANVEGVWEWRGADGHVYRVDLEQEFQHVTGTAWRSDKEMIWEEADLQGDRLCLSLRADDESEPDEFILTFSDGLQKVEHHQ